MNAFLADVTRHLIQAKGLTELADTTIVVPSRRAMLFVKECFRKYMRENGLQGPIQLPQLTSLSQLFDDLSPRYKADEIQLVCTLYRVYNEVLSPLTAHRSPLSLADFYGWGRQLVQDFSNIDKTYPLVTPQSFLSNTASARKLEHLDIDKEVRERLLQLISLREDNSVLAESKRREFERIWENLPLIYERYQEALGQYGYEGARMKAALEYWNDDAIQRRIANRHFVFAGFNYLVPAEKQLMQLLKDNNQATFYWDYPDNFTANTKAFRWIIKNAEQFGNALPVTSWETKPVEVICTATAHAQAQYVYEWLIANHHRGERSAVVICDESALEQVLYALPPNDKINEKIVNDQIVNISKGLPLRNTDIYAKWLNGQINEPIVNSSVANEENVNLTWHEMLDLESRFQLQAALTRFDNMLQKGIIPAQMDERTKRLLLRRYLEGITIPFHGEPLSEIQVTGVLETRALDYDNVLLLNVEEGIVPHVGADLSYLPYYLRKAYGLQTHEESTDVYAYNFFRLIRRAKNVTMMFTGSESRNAKKTMSRFLRQILVSDNFQVSRKILSESNILPEPVIPIARSQMSDVRSQIPNTFSPSALNTFRNCKMQFYFAYVAQIKEPEQESLLLGRDQIGTLVHNAMQELYTRFRSPKDVPETIPFGELQSLGLTGNHPLEMSAIKKFITNIVSMDKQLAAKHDLQIMATEKYAYRTISVLDYGEVRVGGRIDRVDKLDGQIRIIDYKTGSDNPDYDFQLNVYREAYMPQSEAVLYLCKTNEQRTVPYDSALVSNELVPLLHEVLDFISNPPADPLTALAEKQSTCDYCPYKLLCGR